MTFIIGRGFVELQILKKWKWPYLLNRVENCDEICMHIDIVKMYLRDGQMSFVIGRGFAEVQSKKISDDQELIQSDPTSCPQNQKGKN